MQIHSTFYQLELIYANYSLIMNIKLHELNNVDMFLDSIDIYYWCKSFYTVSHDNFFVNV